MRPARRAAWVILALYIAVIAAIAFWPVPVDSGVRRQLGGVLFWLERHGLGLIDYAVVEFTANVMLFAILGLLLGWLGGRGRRLILLAVCIAMSLTIELCQAVLLAARFASPGDVIANSLGAAIGIGIAALADRSRAKNVRSSRPR